MFGLSNPLNAMQILFINILMDGMLSIVAFDMTSQTNWIVLSGPPSQSLGVDPVDPAIMRRPPRKKDEPIITQKLLYRVLFSATIIVVGTLFIYKFALSDDHMSKREQTMVCACIFRIQLSFLSWVINKQTFTCFVFLDLVSAIQNRGLGCGLTQNRMLVTTVSISFLVQLTLIYVPFMQAIFQTEALLWQDLFSLLALAGISMSLHEGRRRYERTANALVSYGAEEMA